MGAMEMNKVKKLKAIFSPNLSSKTRRGSLPSLRDLILSDWPGDYLRLLCQLRQSPLSTFWGGGFTKDPDGFLD